MPRELKGKPEIHTVTMDPPWLERGAGKIKRGADRWYPLMKKQDILRTVYQSDYWNDISEDAHMYMWVTNNYVNDGMWVMDALDFRYVTNICWVKVKNNWPDIIDELVDEHGLNLNPATWLKVLAGALRIGLGQYFRGSHELCLFGVRGKAMKPKKALPSTFHAPRGKHSSKPEKIYEIVEATSPGPYLEIFARGERPGWLVWGNEV